MNDKECIKNVLEYYKVHGRHTLPWRKSISAYRVLVSELMLQQTQVVRVAPKFTLWMKTYPTLSALKQASLKDILVLWQGLGYQRRAKALYTIAQKYSSLPKSYEELLALPGIGPYTASAISAFAYNDFAHPVLETNIRTVLIEQFRVHAENIPDAALYDDLHRLEKEKAVQKIGARVWYSALMDYGAYLKSQKISHNAKSKHNVKQSVYKGSRRELRAKVLFAITHSKHLPEDMRTKSVIEELHKEQFITKKGKSYRIV